MNKNYCVYEHIFPNGKKYIGISCDTEIDGKPYAEIVEIARKFIKDMGGFEKFAEWGLF